MPAAAVTIGHAATSRSATRLPARSPLQRQHRLQCVTRTAGELSRTTVQTSTRATFPPATFPYPFRPYRPLENSIQ
eukprot:5268241-Prymnesium_polylepis.1